MPKVIARDTAMAITHPFHGLWLDAHAYAERYWWSHIRQSAPDLFIASRTSTRASDLHDLVVRYIEQHGDDNLNYSYSLGFFAQTIATPVGGAVVRFKLLDTEFKTKNHISSQQDILDSQDLTLEMVVQLDLASVAGPPTVLTCGYQLASDQMSIANVTVVCHHEREVVYRYDVLRGGGMEILPLPGFEGPPPLDLRSRRRPARDNRRPEA